jgi:GMP synthase (glutamine-hydrolysing)
MITILIVEATPAVLIAKGRFDFAAGFALVLRALDASLRITWTNPYDAPLTCDALDKPDAVIFAGSSVDWSTDAPEAAPLRAAMEAVFASGKPVWGSCNGLQLAAVVLGGAVEASPNGVEVGLARDVRMTAQGQVHPMLTGRRDEYAVPCIHRDEISRLPAGATLLAGNAHSPVQAMSYAQGGVDFWGAQYHPELCPADIAHVLRNTGNSPELAGLLDKVETDNAAAKALGSNAAEQAAPGRTVELSNWLAHVAAKAPRL